VAAGIGGGSTDAAATLRVLEAVTGLDLEARQRDDLALSLGADLPVCLAGTPTIMRGIGEILTPVGALPPLGVVLVNPRVPLSTPEVFARYANQQPRYRGDLAIEVSQFGDRGPLIEFLRETGNDLAAAATAVQPAIGEMLSALQRNSDCLLARMSGSGATCFGLFADAAQAITAADGLSAKHGQWWCESGRLLSQAPDVIAA